MDTFWADFEYFNAKTGVYLNRDHILNSMDIRNGLSHIWHKKNSLRFTKIIGRVSCILCSKILGIGLAERSWGDVKNIKKDMRAHLSAEVTKMQATIFGSNSAEKADLKCRSRLDDPSNQQYEFWNEEYFINLGLERFEVEIDME